MIPLWLSRATPWLGGIALLGIAFSFYLDFRGLEARLESEQKLNALLQGKLEGLRVEYALLESALASQSAALEAEKKRLEGLRGELARQERARAKQYEALKKERSGNESSETKIQQIQKALDLFHTR